MVADNLPQVEITLLGGFRVSIEGKLLDVGPTAQRLIALLALEARPVPRQYVIGKLWPDHTGDRALGNLRSTLWRLRRDGSNFVWPHGEHLLLGHSVHVDVWQVTEMARKLVHPDAVCLESDLDPAHFKGELLPDWYLADDWIILEQERLRQMCLHALEAIANRLIGMGRYAEGVDAALIAIAADPYRESARRTLIQGHLAEGNKIEAAKQYRKWQDTLAQELGSVPSEALKEFATTFLG